MRSMVRPTSPIIAGSRVTTTYASSAATKSPAPARPSTTRFCINLWGGGGRRRNTDRGVEAGDVNLDHGMGAAVAERSVKDRLADQVVGRVDPDARADRSAGVQLRQKAMDLFRRVAGRHPVCAGAVDLVGRDVSRVGAGRDDHGQPGRAVEQLRHVWEGRRLRGRSLLKG